MLLTPDQRRAATHGIPDDTAYDALLALFEAAVQEAIEGYTDQLFAISSDPVVYTFDAPAREVLGIPPLADAAPVVTLAGTPLVLNTDYQLLTADPHLPYTRTRLCPHWRGVRRLVGGVPTAWLTGLTATYAALTIESAAWRWDVTVPGRAQTAATALLRQVWDRQRAGWGAHAGSGDTLTDTVRTLIPATVADLLADYKEAARVHL